jgi:hypothetical protein
MDPVIQAKCPHCQSVLRMPPSWLGQIMRCKHCGQLFQTKARMPGVAPAPPRPAAPAPGIPMGLPANAVKAAPAAAPPLTRAPVAAPADPFAFGLHNAAAGGGAPVIPYRHYQRGNPWVGAFVGVVLLAGGTAALLFAWPHVLANLEMSGADGPAEKKVVQAKQTKPEEVATTPSKTPTTDTSRPKVDPKGPPKKDPPPKLEPKDPPKKGPPTVDPPKKDPPKKEPPPKEDPPKKDPPPKKIEPKKVRPTVVRFPRRALAISVSEYWLANPLNYGRGPNGRFPGSDTYAVLKGLGSFHLKFPNTQLTELSDQGLEPHPPVKSVIESTIAEFCNTSRAQDRIVLLFAGHAAVLDKEAYLVPQLGDLKDAKTLIPLSWVYDQLKGCKARQKVLILDVCRFDPARGMERPGSEKMDKLLDAKLLAPPEGVQVWSSCVAGQNAYEFESGSLFLQALCTAMQEPLPGFQEPDNPLPLDVLVPRVNKLLTATLAGQKLEQTSRLTGQETAGGAPFNLEEPLPQVVMVRPPPMGGGGYAPAPVVQKILDEIASVPTPRTGRPGVKDGVGGRAMPPFPAKDLEPFADDGKGWLELATEGEKYPLRAAVAKAVKALQESSSKFAMKEFFGGANTAAVKKQVLKEQAAPGKAILYLEDALEEMVKAGEARRKEKSKRWQAHYDYVMARLKSRLVYVMEYDYVLAQIRNDALPPLDKGGFAGYRLGSLKKVTIPEGKVKNWVKEIDKGWKKVINDYPETPWALIARREQLTVLGLEWRPSRD